MKNRMRLAAVLALVSVVLVGMAAATYAQGGTQPPDRCDNAKYDIDGDGSLDRQDLNAWKLLFVRSGCKDLGSEVNPDGCSPRLDLDGDGAASRADLDELIQTYMICLRPEWTYPDQ